MDTAVSAEDMAQLETELTEVKANFKEERTFLIAEIKELNAEVERLKKDTSDMGTWVGSKMLQPEWDSFKQSLEVIEYWKTRAEKAEADTARVDWLEKEALQQDWGPWSMNRASIDAAIKESNK
jgi:hypothetical protein